MTAMSETQLLSKFRTILKESDVHHDSLNDEVLICFIRARKNDLHRAHSLLKNYIKMSKNYPELLVDLTFTRLQPILALGHFFVSPLREQNGCRVVIFKIGHWNINDCGLDDAFRGIVYSFQKLVSEFETQTNGIVAIFDFNGFSISQVRYVTPIFMKKLADLVQDVFPIRLYGIHILHEPWVFKILLSMVWPFLSAKMRSRIFSHGFSYDNLHQQVNPSCLPLEYQGHQGTIHEMNLSKVIPEHTRNIFENVKSN